MARLAQKCQTQDSRGQNTCRVDESISGTWMSRNLSRGSGTLEFYAIELGGFYLDIITARQYTTATDSIARRSCQNAMYHIIQMLVRVLAPILSFTADEVW